MGIQGPGENAGLLISARYGSGFKVEIINSSFIELCRCGYGVGEFADVYQARVVAGPIFAPDIHDENANIKNTR